MTYSGEAQVGGRLASVGQRLMESSTQALLKQSLESLATQINARVTGETQPGESIPVEPPSELEFAAGITLKMLEDLIPAEERRGVVLGVVGSLALLVLSILIGNWWMDKLASRVADKIDRQRSA